MRIAIDRIPYQTEPVVNRCWDIRSRVDKVDYTLTINYHSLISLYPSMWFDSRGSSATYSNIDFIAVFRRTNPDWWFWDTDMRYCTWDGLTGSQKMKVVILYGKVKRLRRPLLIDCIPWSAEFEEHVVAIHALEFLNG